MPIGFLNITSHPELVDSTANLTELLFNQIKYNETEKTDVKKAKSYVYKFQSISYKNYAAKFFSKKGKEFVGNIKLEYEYYFVVFDDYVKSTLDFGHVNFTQNNLLIKYEENGEVKNCKGTKFTYTFTPDANCNFNGFTEIEFFGEVSANNYYEKKKVTPITHSLVACYDCENTVLTKYGLYYNGRGLKIQAGVRVDVKIHMPAEAEGLIIVGDKSPTNAGKFDLYINDLKYGTVDTHLITPYEETQISGSTLYQAPLFSYSQLYDKFLGEDGSFTEKNFTISIRCIEGPVTIAGLVGHFDILPVDDFNYSSHVIPYDPLFDENILPVDNFTSDSIVDDPDVNFTAPLNSTFEEILHTCNETDNSTTCNQTVTPNDDDIPDGEYPPEVVPPSETSSSSSTESESTTSSSTESESTTSSSSTESESTTSSSSSSSTESESTTSSSSSSTESESTTSSSTESESTTSSSSSSTESESTTSSSTSTSTESESTSSSSTSTSTESESTTSSSTSTESESTSSSSTSTESESTTSSSSSSTESESTTSSSSSSTESESTTTSSTSTKNESTPIPPQEKTPGKDITSESDTSDLINNEEELTESSSSENANSAKLSKGAIAGVVAGGVIGFVAIVAIAIVVALYIIKRSPKATAEGEELVDDNDFSLDI
ncbi:hypothetical protein TVAG_451380 [Trichomonas vaginalis G3]|uniref:Uncharacterized protein n=1 Tax=Trichomonas vaginalis (strain ATCC PRA-98 / G3) TaxID=412133 RepID=A2FD98_TRIV3|nr:experimental autoimmune prostatitis antigen 2-related family [Trichomonas vaginalis G3]EAX97100.1 hypothetical protein TVAG_451380 [Trichomonas vaginalis G3]KAI5513224.1 experimental autoimmune prostatitis antigen 2-related family [Trichomonas vaginalis G3]|eukprot:XP_001310030.1 hypothetical protein [Trichomonas vaginalis G3]